MVHIREAGIDDLPAILEIYNEAIRNTTATFDLKEQSLEERKIWYSKYGEKHPLIVADIDGEIAGYSCISPFREKAAYDLTKELSIYIAPNHQGKGLGNILMEEIIQRAKSLDYHVMIGGITGGNEASVRLHKKFGFQFAGAFKEVGYKFDQWQDVHFYQLILQK
ncbi:GNAT family N-acetyltransferase [Jeotgalibacillus soli]|uniref:GNAT family acetyltransferase n=1 Tax=Jeotgalibacillus soli TaxID=889306 RepID=A0A0C2RNX7_9BACL|nr:GNAT family N-acetyltransferase [Jeotgalibacillus soli]KIL51965.1 GNAT family acetyltransferase [Jeotgalibacillus soli]